VCHRSGSGAITVVELAPSVLFIQFARAPREGEVKTRMIPHLSPRQACELHCELVLWTCRRLLTSGLGTVQLSVAGDPADPLFAQCRAMGVDSVTSQSGADLGERMYRAIQAGLQCHSRVILVGSDCPGIDEAYLSAAVRALERAPLVLGPAQDGGYVLIGAREIRGALFEGIRWGTSGVYAQTAGILREQALEWVELPTLADVDRPADLAQWEDLRSAQH